MLDEMWLSIYYLYCKAKNGRRESLLQMQAAHDRILLEEKETAAAPQGGGGSSFLILLHQRRWIMKPRLSRC